MEQVNDGFGGVILQPAACRALVDTRDKRPLDGRDLQSIASRADGMIDHNGPLSCPQEHQELMREFSRLAWHLSGLVNL